MKDKIQFAVRCISAGALMVGVYSETGKWTVIALVLIFLGVELQSFIVARLKAIVEALIKK